VINIIDISHFAVAVTTNFHIITFGIAIGSNSFTGKRPDNFFIEIECLFWCFGIEIKRYE